MREPFFDCPTAGALCVSTIVCGDSKVIGDEACDDGNKVAGDGCSADCKQVEPKHSCPRALGVGGPCIPVIEDKCGDGSLSFANGEFCDDGNVTAGDGCGATCRVEAGYSCPQAGMACLLADVAATAGWRWPTGSSATTATWSPATAAPPSARSRPTSFAPRPGRSARRPSRAAIGA